MKNALLFVLCITLSACGANINVHKPIPNTIITDSEKGGYTSINIRAGETAASNNFIGTLSKNLRQYLSELSLYPKKESLLEIQIQITDYSIKTGASRGVMGTLAGADEVKSTVQVINTNTNQVIGESIVFTSSSMAYGQKAMAWVHADDIATFLSTPN
ncbi:hypothetical protein ACFL3U_04960 [Pseudomonadota bacterium]